MKISHQIPADDIETVPTERSHNNQWNNGMTVGQLRLDAINSMAEWSPGFIWRLQTNEGDATAIQAFDDRQVIVNMSIWDNIDQLKIFVYKTLHTGITRFVRPCLQGGLLPTVQVPAAMAQGE